MKWLEKVIKSVSDVTFSMLISEICKENKANMLPFVPLISVHTKQFLPSAGTIDKFWLTVKLIWKGENYSYFAHFYCSFPQRVEGACVRYVVIHSALFD